jgi:hypothetical protein
MSRLKRWSAILAGVVLLAASCRAPEGNTTTFLWRTAAPDVPAAADRVADAVIRQLETSRDLPQGYPLPGHVVTEPDPSEPGVERMSCAPGLPVEGGETRCILLSEDDDFIRVQPVTWQCEAFFMYRVYVARRSLFARVDPAKDFVAVDVFFPGNAALWQVADGAIRGAVSQLGARPFRA